MQYILVVFDAVLPFDAELCIIFLSSIQKHVICWLTFS
jgi:hypothetical protein